VLQLQCIAVSYVGDSDRNVRRVAVCRSCSVLQRVAACCSVLQRASVCCSVLQLVAVCRSVVYCGIVCWRYGVAMQNMVSFVGLFYKRDL